MQVIRRVELMVPHIGGPYVPDLYPKERGDYDMLSRPLPTTGLGSEGEDSDKDDEDMPEHSILLSRD